MVRVPCEPIAECERQYMALPGYNPKGCTVAKRVGELWRTPGTRDTCNLFNVAVDTLPWERKPVQDSATVSKPAQEPATVKTILP
jgi:hypothetical protein